MNDINAQKLQGLNILILEQHLDTRNLYEGIGKTLEANITVTSDTELFLSKLDDDKNINLVIINVWSEYTEVHDLFKKIVNNIPVLFTSSTERVGLLRMIKQLNHDRKFDFIKKTFHLPDFFEKINNLVS